MRRVYVLFGALALVWGACKGKASESDIDRWRASESSSQIAEAMTGRETTMAVRLRAAQALVELAADAHFASALGRLDTNTRTELARELGPDLDRLFASSQLASQVLAKDFLGLLILAGDRHTAERTGPGLVQWLMADLKNRVSLGKVSAVELLKRIGTPALPALHAAIRPGNDLLLLARVIQGIGDKAGVAHAADLMAQVAQAEGRQVSQRTLRALFTLGGDRAARNLAEIAASDKFSFRTRRLAAEEMRALGHSGALSIAARLGLDQSQDLYVRESCLVYLEKVCDPASCRGYLDGLWKILKEKGLRIEAASALIKIGGAAELPTLLRRMPPAEYSDKGLGTLAEDIHQNVGAASLPALREALRGKAWPGKIVAIRALGYVGEASDATRLEAMKGDGTRPPGWRVKSTIGEEAARAASRIRQRGK
jgi:HEAT repeat protein